MDRSWQGYRIRAVIEVVVYQRLVRERGMLRKMLDPCVVNDGRPATFYQAPVCFAQRIPIPLSPLLPESAGIA